MALELLETIRAAEQKAQDAVQAARDEGREIVKSVEEACLENERHMNADIRALYQRMMEQKRGEIESGLKAREGQRAAGRERMLKQGRERIPKAAELIVERIVKNGDR